VEWETDAVAVETGVVEAADPMEKWKVGRQCLNRHQRAGYWYWQWAEYCQ